MVLEYLPNGDLYQLIHPPCKDNKNPIQINTQISKEDFPWKLRLLIALDIARGLKALQCNSPPIAHRDLRSPNIFLCSLDESALVRAKVADFGLARTIAPQVYGALDTWQWIAPEAIFEGIFDLRSDIYSMGIVFWEIASRSYPFDEFVYDPKYSSDGVNGDRVLDQMKTKRAVINVDLRPTLPPPTEECPAEFAELIKHCWEGDPGKRPEIDEVCTRLSKMTNTELNNDAQEKALLRSSSTNNITDEVKIELKKHRSSIIIRLNLDDLREYDSESHGNWLTSRKVAEKLQSIGFTPPSSPHAVSEGNSPIHSSSSTTISNDRQIDLKRSQTTLSLMSPTKNSKTPIISKSKQPRPKSEAIRIHDPLHLHKKEQQKEKDKENENDDNFDTSKDMNCYLFKKIDQIKMHDISVISTHDDSDHIFVGTNDGQILIFSADELELQRKWLAHEVNITSILCVKPRVIKQLCIWSGDSNGVLRIWAEEDGDVMKQEWKPFSKSCNINIFCLFNSKASKVWVGSTSESDIFVFDPDSAHLLHKVILPDKITPTTISQVHNTVWVGTNTGKIFVYSASSAFCLSWEPHSAPISGICAIDNTVWTSSQDGTLGLWKFNVCFFFKLLIIG